MCKLKIISTIKSVCTITNTWTLDLGAFPMELPDRMEQVNNVGPTQCWCIIRIAWCLGDHVRVLGVNLQERQGGSHGTSFWTEAAMAWDGGG